MTSIRTPGELKAAYRIDVIEPFGLKITARRDRAVSRISGSLLDGIVKSEKLVLLRGFDELPREELLAFCTEYPGGGLLHWESGPVMEMKESPDAKNYLFSNERVPFHWDGAFHKEPGYLVFNCIEAPPKGAGGETLFSDTETIWEKASPEERRLWSGIRLTYETGKLAHYGGKITVPMAQRHPRTRHPILRFAEEVTTELNPVSLSVDGIPDESKARFLSSMKEIIYSPEYCYRHQWTKGDLLIADNHALLHGRNAFVRDCARHLRRIQIL